MKSFEYLGKKVLKKHIFFFIVGCVFFLCSTAIYYQMHRFYNLNKTLFRIEMLRKKTDKTKKARLVKQQLLKNYQNPDPLFLEKNIEQLNFFIVEKELIESLLKHSVINNNLSLKERLNFLKNDNINKLRFIEEDSRSSKLVKETEEKQLRPIQINEKDLKNILSIIEPKSFIPNSPQLIIKKLHLDKTLTNLENETFLLEMQLIKREFKK